MTNRQDHKGEKAFGRTCKEEVVRYELSISKDYRLNYRLFRRAEGRLIWESCAWSGRLVTSLQSECQASLPLSHPTCIPKRPDGPPPHPATYPAPPRIPPQNPRACKPDVGALCKDLCKVQDGEVCGGKVLGCLTERVDDINSAGCRKEVMYFMKMEVQVRRCGRWQ